MSAPEGKIDSRDLIFFGRIPNFLYFPQNSSKIPKIQNSPKFHAQRRRQIYNQTCRSSVTCFLARRFSRNLTWAPSVGQESGGIMGNHGELWGIMENYGELWGSMRNFEKYEEKLRTNWEDRQARELASPMSYNAHLRCSAWPHFLSWLYRHGKENTTAALYAANPQHVWCHSPEFSRISIARNSQAGKST